MQAEPHAEADANPAPAPDTPESDLETRRRGQASTGPRPQQNVRLSNRVQKLFGLLLLLVLLLAFYSYRLYQNEIKPALAQIKRDTATPQTNTESSAPPVARAIEIQLPADARQVLDEAAAKNDALERRLETVLSQQKTLEERLQKLTAQVAAVTAGLAEASAASPVVSTSGAAGITTDMPASTAFDEPKNAGLAELRLMKERNRLSAYADEAIATGARRPLMLLIESMKDPERATLYHAASSEYYRIMGHYQLINRIDPAYHLPVGQLFPDGKVRDEADLDTEQIIELLRNKDLEWQPRLRAAFLLGGRRTPEVGAALLQALKEDPNLDVAKEAQLSFEQNSGRHFLLFDIPSIDSWWRAQIAGDSRPKDNDKPEN